MVTGKHLQDDAEVETFIKAIDLHHKVYGGSAIILVGEKNVDFKLLVNKAHRVTQEK